MASFLKQRPLKHVLIPDEEPLVRQQLGLCLKLGDDRVGDFVEPMDKPVNRGVSRLQGGHLEPSTDQMARLLVKENLVLFHVLINLRLARSCKFGCEHFSLIQESSCHFLYDFQGCCARLRVAVLMINQNFELASDEVIRCFESDQVILRCSREFESFARLLELFHP